MELTDWILLILALAFIACLLFLAADWMVDEIGRAPDDAEEEDQSQWGV